MADALALGLRTSRTRRRDEGTTYGEVVDELRKSLAIQYLKDPGMSLGQIAWLLVTRSTSIVMLVFWMGRSFSQSKRVARTVSLAWARKLAGSDNLR